MNRLDLVVYKKINSQGGPYSREFAKELIKSGFVYVNTVKQSKNATSIRDTEVVRVNLVEYLNFREKRRGKLVRESKEKVPLIYQDNNFIFLNKPSGICSHPAGRDKTSILDYFYDIHRIKEFTVKTKNDYGLVHRLDKDTSGAMVLGREIVATTLLSELFSKHQIYKKYVALCMYEPSSCKFAKHIKKCAQHTLGGMLNSCCCVREIEGYFDDGNGKISCKKGELVVSGWIRKKKKHMEFEVTPNVGKGKRAVTILKPLKLFRKEKVILMEVKILTGRTHQIRVVCKYLGIPILGDSKYKNKAALRLKKVLGIEKMMLHSSEIKFLTNLGVDNYKEDVIQSNEYGCFEVRKLANILEYKAIAKLPTYYKALLDLLGDRVDNVG